MRAIASFVRWLPRLEANKSALDPLGTNLTSMTYSAAGSAACNCSVSVVHPSAAACFPQCRHNLPRIRDTLLPSVRLDVRGQPALKVIEGAAKGRSPACPELRGQPKQG